MRNLITLLALAAATPAFAAENAEFTGVRAELNAGYNDITGSFDANDIVYGAAVGVDFPVGERVTLGVEANTSNVFERERQIGTAVRVGYAFNDSVLGYVQGGYTNYQDTFSRSLDGATVGAGLVANISDATFVTAGYRYSDFSRNTGAHAGLVGIGVRF